MSDGWRYVITRRAARHIGRLQAPARRRIFEALDRFVEDPSSGDRRKLRGSEDEWRLELATGGCATAPTPSTGSLWSSGCCRGSGPTGVEGERATGRALVHQAIHEQLKRVARAQTTTTHANLARSAGLDVGRPADRAALGRILGEISTYEHAHGRPMLSAVVVLKGTARQNGAVHGALGRMGREVRGGNVAHADGNVGHS